MNLTSLDEINDKIFRIKGTPERYNRTRFKK